ATRFIALNNSGVSGGAALLLDNKNHNVTIQIDAKGMEPGQVHPQHIHGFTDGTVSHTPTLAQDGDHDGFVELAEGLTRYGQILLNLSLNPDDSVHDHGTTSHDHTGNAQFPTADANGVLHYRQTFHFDPNDANAAAVLASIRDLAKKEIVLHGESVAAGSGNGTTGETDGSAGYKTVLPVASGELKAVNGALANKLASYLDCSADPASTQLSTYLLTGSTTADIEPVNNRDPVEKEIVPKGQTVATESGNGASGAVDATPVNKPAVAVAPIENKAVEILLGSKVAPKAADQTTTPASNPAPTGTTNTSTAKPEPVVASAPLSMVSFSGSGAIGIQIGFDSVARAAAAQGLLAVHNAAVAAGKILPVTIVPGDAIPAGPASGDGSLVVHQGGQVAVPSGYRTIAVDAPAPVTLFGGAGNGQVVVAGTGGLAFNAGAGTGTVMVGGGSNLVSVFEGAGSQNIDLGAGDDTVAALGGNNVIAAGLGKNQILLGSGANQVNSTGNDLIAGGSGAATVTAGTNAPVVFLGSGPSRFIGGGGRATVVGGVGADTMSSSGNSQLWLGSNTDVVNSTGADTVIARTGSATVNADGNMFVFAGSGRMDFHGGAGASTVLGASGASTLHGGAGSVIALAFAPMTYVGGNGADTIAAFGVDSALTATGGSGTALFLAGASGHNSITGGSGTSIIFGGGEGDVLTAGSGAGDTIKAGSGAETISAAGTQGVHKLYAGSGPNLIRTGNNNTNVLLSTGAATISAGTGMDLYAFTQGNHPDVLIQNFKSGADFISLVGFASGEATRALGTATNSGGSEHLTLTDGTRITFQNFTGLTSTNFM
ncbi:MAG: hypothetical protein H7251_09620, partial [Acetobacteraceae bacterium]|nr:hypothetical protein [Acetobacteraceae bacterium]